VIFTVQVSGLEHVFQKVAGFRTAFRSSALWAEIGARLRANILERTARGVDADKAPFVGYSPRYKLYRKKYGHPVKKVNLFWSGTMLSSIDVEALTHGARLYFLPTQAPDYPVKRVSPKSPEKAYYLQEHDTKPRTFFAISKQDVQEVKQMLLKVLEAV
jgi:hypothetical protein